MASHKETSKKPPKYVDRHKTQTLGLRVSPDLVNQYRAIAKANNSTLTAEITRVLANSLPNASRNE